MAGEDCANRGPRCHARKITRVLTMGLVIASLGLMGSFPDAAAQVSGQSSGSLTQNPLQSRFPRSSPNFPKPTRKQKQALMDQNFKKLKKNAKDLAELAKSLQEEIEKTNENVLSLEIVRKAEQAEKLAKQIKEEAKGN